MGGEKLPLGRTTKNRVSVNRRVAAECCRKEPLWVEGTREGFRKEEQWLEGP